MGAVRLEVIDTDTGEVVQKRTNQRKFKARWFMSDIDGSKVLAEMNLSKNEYRVLFMLQSKLNYNNRMFINKAELAREFKCSRSMISNTIATLEKLDVLLKMGRFYKFNNSYIRCGVVKHEE